MCLSCTLTSMQYHYVLTLCLPHSPICTSVNVPCSPICTVIHTPMVHSYCSMKRLPLFLVRTVCMRYQYAFLEFSIQFTRKKIQRVEHSTSKCRPNSSVPQNNVAHGGFVLGKQRVNLNIFQQDKCFYSKLGMEVEC